MNNLFRSQIIADRYLRGAPAAIDLGQEARAELAKVVAKFEQGHYQFGDRACAICDGREFVVLAEHDRYGMPINTTMCCHCGLIQTNPDMRESDYADFYTEHYRRLYIADLVGRPQDFFKEEYWRGQKIVSYARRHLNLPKGSLVIEIGCGAGGILQAFSDAGYRVIGTDLGAENLAYGKSRGLDLRLGSLFDLTSSLSEKPSLVVYSHVLEHIREPGKTLDQVRRILADDGHLYVEVPGVKDVRQNVFQGDFLRTFHLAHIYNFSLCTLQNLARKHGFALVAGDESIRSLFRSTSASTADERIQSDYDAALAYIQGTERFRSFYRARYMFRMQLQGIHNWARSLLIGALHRFGLYETVKRRVKLR